MSEKGERATFRNFRYNFIFIRTKKKLRVEAEKFDVKTQPFTRFIDLVQKNNRRSRFKILRSICLKINERYCHLDNVFFFTYFDFKSILSTIIVHYPISLKDTQDNIAHNYKEFQEFVLHDIITFCYYHHTDVLQPQR